MTVTQGPGGKYDDVCDSVLQATEADMVIILVVNGHKGNGFSVSATSEAVARRVPELMRRIADDIERDCDL